ncbi:MAG: hypothetical protein RL385_1884 [Pseudomonadota bacterium]|jgi:hypothetical protein
MMRMCSLALLVALTACTGEADTRTQLVVSVAAEPTLAAQLRALQIQIYPADAVDEKLPARTQRIVIANTPPRALPLSFGIQRARAERLKLVIGGCSDEACGQVSVRQKLQLRFVPGQTSYVSVVLFSSCANAGLGCEGLARTCGANGTCVDVRETAGEVVEPGREPLPDVPLDPTPTPLEDAAVNVPVADAGTARQCPNDNVCQNAIYPCVPDDGASYTCRGQFADWPMPDSVSDAGVPPKYELIGDDVTHDLVTGLEWQRKTPAAYVGCTGNRASPADSCAWSEARAYCDQLTLDSGGWRLPSKIELESLLDFRPEVQTLDPLYFSSTSYSVPYWSSSPNASPEYADRAYNVSMFVGYTLHNPKTLPLLARCVRSRPRVLAHYPSRWVVREDSVADVRTGLSWSDDVPCEPQVDFTEAEQFCAGIGFRMPTAKELLTLIDPTHPTSASQPAIPSYFSKNLTADSAFSYYLSSTPAKGSSERMLVEAAYGQAVTETIAREASKMAVQPRSYCTQCVR